MISINDIKEIDLNSYSVINNNCKFIFNNINPDKPISKYRIKCYLEFLQLIHYDNLKNIQDKIYKFMIKKNNKSFSLLWIYKQHYIKNIKIRHKLYESVNYYFYKKTGIKCNISQNKWYFENGKLHRKLISNIKRN